MFGLDRVAFGHGEDGRVIDGAVLEAQSVEPGQKVRSVGRARGKGRGWRCHGAS
jgi:hypothetical protein